jgi:hypothetical protein
LVEIAEWQFTKVPELREKEELVMRKRIIAYLAVTLMIAGMSIFAAMAADTHHTRSFTISEPMIVGGTMIDEGKYRIRFDEMTGALTVMEMDGDVVASATGEVVQLADDADVTALTTTDTPVGKVLTAVQMHNVNKKLILNCACATSSEGP